MAMCLHWGSNQHKWRTLLVGTSYFICSIHCMLCTILVVSTVIVYIHNYSVQWLHSACTARDTVHTACAHYIHCKRRYKHCMCTLHILLVTLHTLHVYTARDNAHTACVTAHTTCVHCTYCKWHSHIGCVHCAWECRYCMCILHTLHMTPHTLHVYTARDSTHCIHCTWHCTHCMCALHTLYATLKTLHVYTARDTAHFTWHYQK